MESEMATRWKRADGDRLQSSQDLEDSMSQELADLGMLEQGMTFQDKRDLLNVVRLSQKSARAEEEERKTKTWSPHPQCNIAQSSNSTSSQHIEGNSSGKIKSIELDGNESDLNQDILSNLSMALSNCNAEKQTPSSSPPTLDYCGDSGTAMCDTVAESKLPDVNCPNSPITLSSKDSEVGSVVGETGVLRIECEHEKNDIQSSEHFSSDIENEDIFPSVKAKQRDLNNFKKKKDDHERNFDVFSHSSETDTSNFLRRNVHINDDRIPFYFVPEGMSLRKYISYFKCCVNQYYESLAVIQRNNIEHLEWGAPITMDMSSGFASFRSASLDAHGDSVSKRYNFRDRCPKPKLIDFTSENSEDAEEDESNDEDIFTPHHKKLPGIKLSTKRKNTSVNDTLSTKKEKKESPQKKTPDDGESLEDDEQEDNQLGDTADKSLAKNKNASSSRKRARKSRTKLFQSQNETPQDINEIVPNVAIASIIEPDIVIAEGPTLASPQPQLDDITNQPSPLSVKQRRLQLKSKSNGRQNRRKSEPRKNPDVVIVDEEIKPSLEEAIDRVRCPICWQLFPASDIEEHASECNQYTPDNGSSVKV